MVDGLMSEVLRRKAQEAGINGKQLAKMIGVTAETVSRHMNGRTHMSHYDAAKYADALKCDPEEFLYQQRDIKIVGSVDKDHYVKLDNFSGKVLRGPSVLRSWTVAFQYEKDINDWKAGRFVFVDGRVITNKTISLSKVHGKLVIAKARNETTARLCVPYQLPPAPNSSIEEHPIQWQLMSPYRVMLDQNHIKPVYLEWAAPIIFSLLYPNYLNFEVVNGF